MKIGGQTGVLAGAATGVARAVAWAPNWRALFSAALAREIEERRLFLWIPVAAMAGVSLNMAADREPALWLPALLALLTGGLAFAARRRRLPFVMLVGACALCAGFLSTGLRTARVAAPVLDHIRIVKLKGFVEEIDMRRVGARLILRVEDSGDMPAGAAPRRVRVTTRKAPDVAAGDYVALTARLLPPSHASLPGGYDFARDAYFAGIGAVGSTLGAVVAIPPPGNASLTLRFGAAIDRARNALAARVDAIIGGDEGAIAAAMVTGKRDFLSNDAKDLIREAGIFHIITISGVQMTLVAGIFFWTTRRLLALSPTLALRYPIKKWAAAIAILGAVAYDVCTGSRVGTERALIMTLIVLGAVIVDRRALTMRNLGLAVLGVVALEPEAILGVSFQLSFAAVGALVAVLEARLARLEKAGDPFIPSPRAPKRGPLMLHVIDKPVGLIVATLCATTATASFMAYHFHDLSPYVLIGNPLTLTVIEFFAVPGALIGTALYPLGLDAPVWLYVGAGIKFILWVARHIADAPGSTLHVRAFAPYALPFLSLAVVSALIWRSWLLRATAIPFALIGMIGAVSGPRYDIIIAPGGEQAALRDAEGRLAIIGKRFNAFAAEQWLSADGDGREAADARDQQSPCDRFGCVGALPEGRSLALVEDRMAFEEDCGRADIIVSALTAPAGCKAAEVFDERRLAQTGALGLVWDGAGFMLASDRSLLEDRPWSPAPKQPRSDRIERPGKSGSTRADPADPIPEAQ
ncbi:ComEC/Rec2 family competence protein [Methylocapsa sp. S129]|uniref:ComEC/Rec2 family competence protein n=1 Tax=Methylocapsa sp. S129 TaxID=1641869 RepID=UPI00131AD19A|nr:ComEC/Rec2 family competence protein [Methylocapsa sp. S129]